jgi:FkbM family methyltransferase
MRLDLSEWAQRRTFFLGRYYELHLQLLLAELLQPGDRVLDVGANVGMITLCASALVGAAGRVESFEPNPQCVTRLAEHVSLNDIRNVVVHPVALGSEAGRLKLRLCTSRATPSRHSGTGTLTPVSESVDDVIVAEYEVEVARGDDLIGAYPHHPVALVKLDVEGFELNALKGLRETLVQWSPAVVTEYMEEHLSRAGTSRAELRAWMGALGYEPFAFYTRRRGLRHILAVEPVERTERASAAINDVLWLTRKHPSHARYAALREANAAREHG